LLNQEIFTDEVILFLKSVSRIFKENNKEIQIFCPYCGDAYRKENPRWGHLYIGKENGLFYCHRCHSKGNLYTLLVDYGFQDENVLNKLKSYFYKSTLFKKITKTSQFNIYDTNKSILSKIDEVYKKYFKKEFEDEINYLKRRLFIDDISELLKFKIDIEKNKILFCNYYFEPITVRFIKGKYRYKRYLENTYYEFSFTLHNKVYITEGPFDLINIYKLIKDKTSYYLSILGKNYLKALEYSLKFISKNVVLFVDTDIDIQRLYFGIIKLIRNKNIKFDKIEIRYQSKITKDISDLKI